MSKERIDSAAGLVPAALTFSNLCWRYGTGVDTSTGKGAYKKVSYRFGVMTELGDMEINVWIHLMERLIEESGEQWLLDALLVGERAQLCKSISGKAARDSTAASLQPYI